MCRPRSILPPKKGFWYSSQLWFLYDPTAQTVQRVHPGGIGLQKQQVNLPWRYRNTVVPPLDLWTKLVRYDGTTESPLGHVDIVIASLGRQTLPQNSHFSQLPLETMWAILDMLDPSDIVALASTCQLMFKTACSIIAKDIRLSSGDSAGHPIAMIGSHSISIPESFLADDFAYQSMRPRNEIPPGSLHHLSLSGIPWNPCDYLAAARDEYQPPKSQSAAVNAWLSVLASYKQATISRKTSSNNKPDLAISRPIPEQVHNLLTDLLHRTNQPCIFNDPSGTQYYLRNHTTRSLVRICSCQTPHISAHSKNPKDPNHPLTLDDVFNVMARHSDGSRTTSVRLPQSERGKWRTGPWAGHSFDIVSADRHTREHPVSSGSTPIWRDHTTAVLTRACWEHDRLQGCHRIDRLGKPSRGASPRWAVLVRREAKDLWMPYMDSLYKVVMAPFGKRGNRDVEGLVERWRAKFQEIVAECVDGRKFGKGLKWGFAAEVGVKRKLEVEDDDEEEEEGKGKAKAKVVRRSERVKGRSVIVDVDSESRKSWFRCGDI